MAKKPWVPYLSTHNDLTFEFDGLVKIARQKYSSQSSNFEINWEACLVFILKYSCFKNGS